MLGNQLSVRGCHGDFGEFVRWDELLFSLWYGICRGQVQVARHFITCYAVFLYAQQGEGLYLICRAQGETVHALVAFASGLFFQ